MKIPVFDILQSIDESIRNGLLVEARRELIRLPPSQIPRPQYATVANLLRRTGLVSRGLRLLNQIVRSESKIISASEEERIEYAMLLVRHGAIHEARELLSEISADSHPEVLLYQTFTLTPEWRYAETVPLLRQYIEKVKKKPQQQLIAKVNLVAALIYCREDKCLGALIEDAIQSARKQNYNFLLGSLYELAAQHEIAQGRYKEAEGQLKSAAEILSAFDSQESFYVEKWKTIIQVYTNPKAQESQDQLLSLRKRAVRRRDWETARDCDFHRLKFFGSQELFNHLYCGTPNVGYRKRLEENFPQYKIPDDKYYWQLSGKSVTSRRHINIDEAKTGDGRAFTEVGQAPHRLLLLLARDFYRPQRILELAAQVFDGEYTNPIYTPMKMHQVIMRLRADVKAAKLPLRIVSDKQSLRLEGLRNCTIIKDWTRDTLSVKPTNIHISQLSRLSSEGFTAKEAALIWDCSVATATRRLNDACESGLCTRIGKARQTRFRLSHNEMKS